MAVAHKRADIVRLLLRFDADPNAADAKSATPLHIAAVTGDADLISCLILSKADLDAQDSGGWTPLLAACATPERWSAATALLEAGASAQAVTHGRRLNALMLVAEWKFGKRAAEATAALLQRGAEPAVVDVFGETALHVACRKRRLEAVVALCEGGAPTAAQDDDGRFPLQQLCICCSQDPEDRKIVDVGFAAILRADPEAVQRLDFGDSNALHTLLDFARLEKSAPKYACKALLDAQADPTLEDDSGFSAAHYVRAANHDPEVEEAMMALLRASPLSTPKFWADLDLGKQKDTSNRKYLTRRGGHHRIPIEQREAVLGGEVSLAAVARRISEGRSRQVVVLLGAGASTAAGIPDFRSPTGLWGTRYSREALSKEGFCSKPEDFWALAADLFFDRKPTKVHALLAHMAREGLLRRVYTQNIDGLEAAAGVPSDTIVHCHGNVGKVVCSSDRRHVVHVGVADILAQLRRPGSSGTGFAAPRCHCGALLRPDVVFFGEAMPQTYERLSGKDMEACDLLVVVGSSLMVYPVAGLVGKASPLTPRLLINNETVSVWRGCEANPDNYRDVAYQGDCDAGAEELARLWGWTL